MRDRCWALVALVLVAGCTGQARETRPATGAEAGAVAAGSAPAIEFADLPATFEGTLPCADCPGIDYHLDLFPDGVFFLRQRYREREGSFDDIGLWAPASDGSLLSLHGGREAPLRLARTSRDELRLLGADGEPVSSEPDHALRARPVFAPIEPRLLLSGHYRYLADAPLFTECRTGLPMPVALEADNRALEGAYRQARPSPGAPVLVLLEGRIARRMPMEGPGPVATLVPERFLRVRAEQRCAPRFAPAALADTRWVLRQLGDRAVVPRGDGRAPHLVLRGEGGALTGSDGCNRLSGSWRRDEAHIDLEPLATTLMACPDGAAQGPRFAAVLASAERYRIVGRQLELFDGAGVRLARFEAGARP